MTEEEPKSKMKSIFLQLGDVFKITNDSYTQSHYIEYIDPYKIKTIDVESLDKIEFRITTEKLLASKDINVSIYWSGINDTISNKCGGSRWLVENFLCVIHLVELIICNIRAHVHNFLYNSKWAGSCTTIKK
jgi:hypothetical protein